jgi:hypothetical protein
MPGVTGGTGAAPARLRPVCDRMRQEALAGELRTPCHAADVIGSVARRSAVAAAGGSLAGIAFRIAHILTRTHIAGASMRNPHRPKTMEQPPPHFGKPGDARAVADFPPLDAALWTAGQGTGADGGPGRPQAKA